MEFDPIVAEIRAIRERRAARFNFGIRAILEDAQGRDARGDREIVRMPPRRPYRPSEKPPEAAPNR